MIINFANKFFTMNVLLNIIWIIFGGLISAIGYFISSLMLMVTIVGIPFGLQTMKLAMVALWPFGTEIHSDGWPSGCLADIMNVIWWIVGGIPIALNHLVWGIFFCITVIGIPFGMENFKLMMLALFPFGKRIG